MRIYLRNLKGDINNNKIINNKNIIKENKENKNNNKIKEKSKESFSNLDKIKVIKKNISIEDNKLYNLNYT